MVAFERATLYGLVVYSGRRVPFAKADPVLARQIFIREALVGQEWSDEMFRRLPFLAANRKLIAQVESLEHKSRRQDVLVDDELIFAFYDAQIPADVCSGAGLERWWREASRQNPKLLQLSREELMRHEAAGVTTELFPKTMSVTGIEMQLTYHFEPGSLRDGVTLALPLFALNQMPRERVEWLVPGMLNQKIHALLKTLHQRPRSRLVPLPDSVAASNTLVSAFSQKSPRHLDPTASYWSNDTLVTYQVYEPPYGYHYLKRPFVLQGKTAVEVAQPTYLDQAGHKLPADAPAATTPAPAAEAPAVEAPAAETPMAK